MIYSNRVIFSASYKAPNLYGLSIDEVRFYFADAKTDIVRTGTDIARTNTDKLIFL